jgi:hypothetical protein
MTRIYKTIVHRTQSNNKPMIPEGDLEAGWVVDEIDARPYCHDMLPGVTQITRIYMSKDSDA